MKLNPKQIILDLARQYKPSPHDLEFDAAGNPRSTGPIEEDLAQLDFEDLIDIIDRDQETGKPLRVRYFEDLKSKLNPS